MNRTLVECARTMLKHADLPNSYWAEAVSTAVYIRNRGFTNALDKHVTPFERWYGRKPDVSNFRVFGCIAYAHVADSVRQKLDSKAIKVRFLGDSARSKGYRLFDEKSKMFLVRRDVIFNKQILCLILASQQRVVQI